MKLFSFFFPLFFLWFFSLDCKFSFAHDDPLRVLVSSPPLCEFVKFLLGSSANVDCLFKRQGCPHHYEWKPSQIKQIKNSDFLICFSGDPLTKKIYSNVLEDSDRILQLQVPSRVFQSEKFSKKRNDDHYFYDPHILFSMKNACQIVQELALFFQNKIPLKALTIKSNAKKYCKKILELDQKIDKLFKEKKIKTIYVGHSSWEYFSRDYGLELCLLEVNDQSPSLHDLKIFAKKFQNDSIKIAFNTNYLHNYFFKNFISDMGGKLVIIDTLSETFFLNFQKIFNTIKQIKNG